MAFFVISLTFHRGVRSGKVEKISKSIAFLTLFQLNNLILVKISF